MSNTIISCVHRSLRPRPATAPLSVSLPLLPHSSYHLSSSRQIPASSFAFAVSQWAQYSDVVAIPIRRAEEKGHTGLARKSSRVSPTGERSVPSVGAGAICSRIACLAGADKQKCRIVGLWQQTEEDHTALPLYERNPVISGRDPLRFGQESADC